MIEKMFTISTIVMLSLYHMGYAGHPGPEPRPVMRYSQHDYFFDRTVAIFYDGPFKDWKIPIRNTTIFCPGVFITENLILTAYNPFRRAVKSEEWFRMAYAYYLVGRTIKSHVMYYSAKFANVECGRQVVHWPDDLISFYQQWHGLDYRNSPVHDLMVLRVSHEDRKFNNLTAKQHVKDKFPIDVDKIYHFDAFMTEVALPNDTMSSEFKFASIGYRNRDDILQYRRIESSEFGHDEKSLVDCDEYLPREWGHFICVQNKENFPALGSGALLFSKNKLFGIGSFAYFRGGVGIWAFTDVRRYYNLIFQACSYNETSKS